MFDLSKNNLAEQAEVGYKFNLVHPATGEKLDAVITVRGSQSKVVQKYSRKKFQEIEQAKTMAARKGKEYKPSLDDLEDLAIETTSLRVIGWSGIGENGKELEFTPENVAKVLRDHPWIREQVMEESEQLSNFQPG